MHLSERNMSSVRGALMQGTYSYSASAIYMNMFIFTPSLLRAEICSLREGKLIWLGQQQQCTSTPPPGQQQQYSSILVKKFTNIQKK
jgi:hypothetical protein